MWPDFRPARTAGHIYTAVLSLLIKSTCSGGCFDLLLFIFLKTMLNTLAPPTHLNIDPPLININDKSIRKSTVYKYYYTTYTYFMDRYTRATNVKGLVTVI
jgi:hypothetical protein